MGCEAGYPAQGVIAFEYPNLVRLHIFRVVPTVFRAMANGIDLAAVARPRKVIFREMIYIRLNEILLRSGLRIADCKWQILHRSLDRPPNIDQRRPVLKQMRLPSRFQQFSNALLA
jgi:hypothetical protein